MKYILFTLLLVFSAKAKANCIGFPPFANPGCQYVCMDSKWVQVCSANPYGSGN